MRRSYRNTSECRISGLGYHVEIRRVLSLIMSSGSFRMTAIRIIIGQREREKKLNGTEFLATVDIVSFRAPFLSDPGISRFIHFLHLPPFFFESKKFNFSSIKSLPVVVYGADYYRTVSGKISHRT